MDLALVVVAPVSPDGRELEHARLIRHALADARLVETIDLVAERVVPAMSRTERLRYETAEPIVDPLISSHAELVARAAALVFVFPTKWWAPPPILTAWIERTFVPTIAFVLDDQNRVRPNLRHLRAVAGVTTHAHPRVIADGGDGARRVLLRSLRLNAPRRVRTEWLVDPDPATLRRRMSRL